jgi:hypothetical protein
MTDGKGPLVALVTIIGTLVGVLAGNYLDIRKAERLRVVETRSKARELAWNQTADAFQRLFGLRIRLRGDLVTYRDAMVRSNYHGALAAAGQKRHEALELHYRGVVDEYTGRVIEDRSQVQAVLGWLQYVLPEPNKDLRCATESLMNLRLWYAPPPPREVRQLAAWVDAETGKGSADARDEVERKFNRLLQTITREREVLLREPARRYLDQIDGVLSGTTTAGPAAEAISPCIDDEAPREPIRGFKP